MHSDFLASGNKYGAFIESSHDIFILYHESLFPPCINLRENFEQSRKKSSN